ncbi:MAG: hypothetical protein KGQ36_06475 [Rickettsiales bacterium]|nr:hypothetical protein [Rickettsiales bacterium]
MINSLKNRDFLRIKEEEIEEKKIVYSEKAENKYEILDAQDPNPTVENPTISSIQSSFCIIS